MSGVMVNDDEIEAIEQEDDDYGDVKTPPTRSLASLATVASPEHVLQPMCFSLE